MIAWTIKKNTEANGTRNIEILIGKNFEKPEGRGEERRSRRCSIITVASVRFVDSPILAHCK